MHLQRKIDLSIYYWLRHLDWLTINDGYPEADLQLPSITVESDVIRPVEYEMGNRDRLNERLWVLDVIGKNKDQRDELSYKTLEELNTGIPVYDYDEGFPPSVSPTQLGLLRATDITAMPVRIFPELVEKMYWRTSIRFYSEYNPF
jgi:hypothetical protein